MIRAVAFDVMDTLVVDQYRNALLAATGLTFQELIERRPEGVYASFECGLLTEDEYWQRFRDAGISCDADAFHRVRRDGTRWIDGMDTLLDDLAGKVLRVTASNYPVWIEELGRGILAARLDRVIASYQLGVRKPDSAFYTKLLDVTDLTPEQVLFVDDREENVVSAEQVGIASHQFIDADTLRTWLIDQGVHI
ncbi:MAG: HAD-IA family hydrolase [Nitriliruptoraceae bacterium]